MTLFRQMVFLVILIYFQFIVEFSNALCLYSTPTTLPTTTMGLLNIVGGIGK